jgi:deoxyadenosine/deoxycytidine kinase/NTP pyrophosphatase (non-canonical NTP hydrolase)
MAVHPIDRREFAVPPYPYIAIEGAIGVGKTSLARILGHALSAEILLEVFEENPFLSDFYTDRARYAFQTQIFFLLSRYRQQHRVIVNTVKTSPLVSDYLFAKDWLFAHLNLAGDELTMYERVHSILGEQIPTPNLVVYLRAPTETLMRRIAFRDRAYERQMSPEYIEALRLAYDTFFRDYTAARVLSVDTEDLDFVHDNAARMEIIGRTKNAILGDAQQLPFPDMAKPFEMPAEADVGRRIPEFQRIHRQQDRERGATPDLFFDFIVLTEDLGEVGRTLRVAWDKQSQILAQVGNREEAKDKAIEAITPDLQRELADLFTALLKLANSAGIDLESAYISKCKTGCG